MVTRRDRAPVVRRSSTETLAGDTKAPAPRCVMAAREETCVPRAAVRGAATRAGRPTKATADMTKAKACARRGRVCRGSQAMTRRFSSSGLAVGKIFRARERNETCSRLTTRTRHRAVRMTAMACHHYLSARVSTATAPRVATKKSVLHRRVSRSVTRASADVPSAQLGTAVLPKNRFDESVFVNALFQWANGLTTSGQNLPFALPQRVDSLEFGFSMAFLQSDPKGEPGTFVSVGEIVAVVEDVENGGRALIIRGTGKAAQKGMLVDVPMVMNTMLPAIKNGIAMASQ